MRCSAVAFLCVLLVATTAAGEETYYQIAVQQLRIVEGQLPPAEGVRFSGWRSERAKALSPTVRIDGAGESFLSYPVAKWTSPKQFHSIVLAVRVPKPREVTGWLAVPKNDLSGMTRVRFVIPADAGTRDVRAAKGFHAIKEEHYRRLLDRDTAGAAWFRARFREARIAQDKDPAGSVTGWKSRKSLTDTFGLFSGSRAISENLQLHRQLQLLPDDGGKLVPVKSLTGVTVEAKDWRKLTAGLEPKLDPLATRVPHDQVAVFSASFSAFLQSMDEFDEFGTEVLLFLEPRNEDRGIGPWYRRQMCVDVTVLDRLLGDKLVASVVLTGSDATLRTGVDAGVLFEPKNLDGLFKFLRTKQLAAKGAHPGVRDVKGTEAGVEYIGVRSSDRRICSYLFKLDGVVGVTNSLVQLRRLAETTQKKRRAMAALDQYRFYRHRYELGKETGFVMVPDAAIRRLASPGWRIASSRRTRAAAIMAELQAENLDELVAGEIDAGGVEYPRQIGGLGRLAIVPDGVRSSVYGSMEFFTPVAEVEIDEVTPAEAEAYQRWRRGYEKNWRVLAPIAIQFSLRPEELTADVSVIPMIGGGAYQQLVKIAGGGAIAADAGDPHAGTVLHATVALDTQSKFMKDVNELASLWFGIKGSLSWLGSTAAVYVDDDPVWKEFLEAADPQAFWEERGYQIPLAVYVGCSDAEKLGRVLSAAQRLDNLLTGRRIPRETRRHNGVEYVKVLDNFISGNKKQAFYYAAAPKALILSLKESTLKKSIDRQQALGKPAAGKLPPRLGKHLNIYGAKPVVELWQRAFGDSYRTVAQVRSWSNLPILNHWRRRYPEHDPVDLHRRFWNVTLTCPGGGIYRWNPTWQTMESTAYGHPGEPKTAQRRPSRLEGIRAVNFGITFEHDGLRAKAIMRRVPHGG